MHTKIERLMGRTRILSRSAQLAIFALSAVGAFLLRFEFIIPAVHLRHLFFGVAAWAVVKSVVFHLHRLDRGWWRFVSTPDLVRIASANCIGSIAGGLVIFFFGPSGFPRSLYLLDFLLCFGATAGIRLAVRLVAEATAHGRNGAAERNTLIYGAGDAGITLLREIQKNPKLPYRVRGFLDDRTDKKGAHILGAMVLGGGDLVEQLAAKHNIEIILIAIPSATGAEMTRILERCHAAGVECKTIPGLGEVIEERGLAGQIRDVAVEDLLGRKPVRLEEERIQAKLEGRVVLVTGAGGSIGSELCRQIARFGPAGIVGFENAESPLFEIDREMRGAFPGTPFYAEIGSIQNRARLEEVLRRYSPSVVYHAAAYKHVPLMEAHVFEAVENNVFGTYNVAMAAAECGVEEFVLISSDKAVRPTNVMGATKRVAELVVMGLAGSGERARGTSGDRGIGRAGERANERRGEKKPDAEASGQKAAAERGTSPTPKRRDKEEWTRPGADAPGQRDNGRPLPDGRGSEKTGTGSSVHALRLGQSSQSPVRTKYVAVRFGNVLGSNGSVIPIFKKQIAAGGPVTVTHPEMRRFFMTIPEACQLVLQAAVIGQGGQICVLDMGEPVKIVDLARNLILLSGLKPDEDIKIEFTGMRPGEKLYEEVTTLAEETAPTAHEKIRIFVGNGMPEGDVGEWLEGLREICEARDAGRLVLALKEIVLDYSPSAHLLKRVIARNDRHAAATAG